MICSKCNNQLRDNAKFCNVCGTAQTVYDPPAGFALDAASGRYYRNDHNDGTTQWVTWFDANTGEYEQGSYPVAQQSAPIAQPQPQPKPEPTPIVQTVQHPVPEGFKQDWGSGLYYILTPGQNPASGEHGQWVTWFNPNTGEYTQQFTPSQPAQATASRAAKTAAKKPMHAQRNTSGFSRLAIVLPIIALLVGLVVAFYQTSIQSDAGLVGIELVDIERAPVPVVRFNSSVNVEE